mmetsp:Transcript_5723/g.12874  ORF Transcript_5723/g.12874 Transcript_5723/m.12874 type:complete len:203 (+) Transcript_5723:436-1044(+)
MVGPVLWGVMRRSAARAVHGAAMDGDADFDVNPSLQFSCELALSDSNSSEIDIEDGFMLPPPALSLDTGVAPLDSDHDRSIEAPGDCNPSDVSGLDSGSEFKLGDDSASGSAWCSSPAVQDVLAALQRLSSRRDAVALTRAIKHWVAATPWRTARAPARAPARPGCGCRRVGGRRVALRSVPQTRRQSGTRARRFERCRAAS